MSGAHLSKIEVEFTVTKNINYAMQQNHVPVVRQLVIHNAGETDLEKITVSLTAEPEFAHEWTGALDYLRAGESFSFTPVTLNISPVFLAALTERIAGGFKLEISDENERLYKEYYQADLLAYDQWNGAGQLPEMLAAFVTPNHPQIVAIIREASETLARWTGNPSFNEYQSRNPDRVRKQMAALYEAIAARAFLYCSVPASFEESGQRIRMADSIFAQKMANCLDLSLLFAACLEAVGIHPLLVLMKGHVFVGSWLVDESFAEVVNDDPSVITKRTAEGINEIAIVEATCLNSGNDVAFDDAVKLAEQQMATPSNFNFVLDVKRARFGGIRPLPLRIAGKDGWEIADDTTGELKDHLPADLVTDGKLTDVDHIETSKQELWERKLLDLTLRNTLLNVRVTKSVVQFMTVNTAKLEDALAAGKEFQVLAKPNDWENPLRDAGIYKAIHAADPVAELVNHELTQQRIRTYLPDLDLNGSLTALFRSSRIALEENGANTLYVGIGMMKWFETDASEKARYAPVLLMPVEIIRKSAQRGYIIRNREEETIINITLLEMLRQDFGISIGGLSELPKDESGVDVRRILNIVRQAIMSRPRWDIEEQAILGNFSFNKFILWSDIHYKSDELSKNDIVASLVSGRLEYDPDNGETAGTVAGDMLNPAATAIPISADSSQLEAILSAGEGQSFVLHGPPGTGKSQTITNIIANALYAGKKVLFVSAKKAALEVVQKRLNAIGIGDFCLELHSNKSKKSEVLEQLRKATEALNHQPDGSHALTADRLLALRTELNAYVQALHQQQAVGLSLFDLFTQYNLLPDAPDVVYFPDESLQNLTKEKLTNWNDLAEQYTAVAEIVTKPASHPLKEINLKTYSAQFKYEIKAQLDQAMVELAGFSKSLAAVSEKLKLNTRMLALPQLEAMQHIATLLLQLPNSPAGFFATDSPEQILAQLTALSVHGKKRDELRTLLSKDFTKALFTFPAEETLTEWHIASGKWFLAKYVTHNKITGELKKFARYGKLAPHDVPALLENIIAWQQEQQVIDKASYLPGLLGFLWKDGEPDWDLVTGIADVHTQINHHAYHLTGLQELRSWRSLMAAAFTEGSSFFIRNSEKELRLFTTDLTRVSNVCKQVETLLGLNFEHINHTQAGWAGAWTETITRWLAGLERLKDWFNYSQVRDLLLSTDLTPLVYVFENGSVQPDQLVIGFQKGLYRSYADFVIQRNTSLSAFNGQLFAGKIKRFRDISETFESLTRQELVHRLVAKIPSFTKEASQSSEIGILQKTFRNNGRAMPIRTLFQLIPNLLPRLAPCMLMSPISVAQYFETGATRFDLVIFDEASQLPTCEAVGAIARGNSLVVVGDPKQMPPTNFFSTNNIDEDNILKEDLESILDDCLALSMPEHHLRWHYRSRHESLIAFSNANYYDNKLLTFPSTDDLSSRVKLIKVKGFYDKGKTRQNRAEAKAITDYIIYRLSTPELATKSMGVVTFSSTQQALVEDMLTEVFALRPDLEKMAYETAEPLFIKNLENVQGDERDIILFSVGYGPDEQGKVSLNFGPVNREGGWRRLNVAVSRARYEMKVFSTLTAEQIDLNRTGSEGAAGLKAFLAYAANGRQALPISTGNFIKIKPGLEEVIAAEIRKHGYKVNTNVGSSEFKIDIGIVHPDHPGHYILAVLLDGKTYYAARTPGDREIIQPDVLKALGWNIIKVWSTEWWENREKVIQGILEAVKRAGEEVVPVTDETTYSPEPETLATAVIPLSNNSSTSNSIYYTAALVEPVLIRSADEFFEPRHRETIKSQLEKVVNTEGPVSKDLLFKRVLTGWGIARTGARINQHLENIFAGLGVKCTSEYGRQICWAGDQQPDTYSEYRVAENESLKRDAEDLPVSEVANAVKDILKNQLSLSKTDLLKEAARLFGYARIGSNVEMAMLNGIQHAIFKGFGVMKGDRVIYRE